MQRFNFQRWSKSKQTIRKKMFIKFRIFSSRCNLVKCKNIGKWIIVYNK